MPSRGLRRCGVILDAWMVHLSDYGMDTNDGGRWMACGVCDNYGRHHRLNGVNVCMRGIEGTEPS